MNTIVQPRPLVRWVGGKRKLIPDIVARMPRSFGAYHEPFMGGAALFWHLQPKRAFLSDANERLVRTYRGVRDSVGDVIALLKTYPNEKAFFLEMRSKCPDASSDVDVAAWFIYINKTCFNGLYRVNRKNQCNSPFGELTNPTICDEANLRACSAALANADIQHAQFNTVLARAKPGDFCYADPPYVPLSDTSDFTSYTADGFTHEDQRRLRDVAVELRGRGVSVVLSNSDTPQVRELYAGFQVDTIMAARAINCVGEKRGKVAEVLIHSGNVAQVPKSQPAVKQIDLFA